jgi:hypothetical protein
MFVFVALLDPFGKGEEGKGVFSETEDDEDIGYTCGCVVPC